ncbi:MAG: hypothetical protein MK212_07170 [Saprospiraceae bacterium]|nr:hypothetical protein [Saprospiraceae bacterium]
MMHPIKKIALIPSVCLVLSCGNTTEPTPNKENTQTTEQQTSDNHKDFLIQANKLLENKKYDELLVLTEAQINASPKTAMFYQFKGVSLLSKYEEAWSKSTPQLQEALAAFEKAKELDPTQEDKALAGLSLAYLVSKDMDKASKVFEPALKKYPQSVHLNYVGIKYYELQDQNTDSQICMNFIKENDPAYNGKPVFVGALVGFAIKTVVEIFIAAIILSYSAGVFTSDLGVNFSVN